MRAGTRADILGLGSRSRCFSTFIISMRNDSYPRWHDSTDAAECAVVLVIVRDDYQALLLLCQYELNGRLVLTIVFLYIGPSLFKRGINVSRGLLPSDRRR